jgi:CRISPR-associated endonuclease/helicase Cas3
LTEHLQQVAERSAEFAAAFGSADLGRLAGLWHDLGKNAPDWQQFLLDANEDPSELDAVNEVGAVSPRRRGPDHSTAGAIHALTVLGANNRTAMALAFAIAAHHAGLSDKTELQSRTQAEGKRRRYESCLNDRVADLLAASDVELPHFLQRPAPPEHPAPREYVNRRFETFVRMLFSALVDADRLATESFIEHAQGLPPSSVQRSLWLPLEEYVAPLDVHLAGLDRLRATPVNTARRQVLAWCREAAAGPQGAYSLTVPTGGGKTLSSLAFALAHARAHRLGRIIVALPFISILDQTADVFQRIFSETLGSDVLVEHHSNLHPQRATLLNGLASENWDAPLVVTTQVQLFDSLFSNRPRDCRKLHNLARSVVVLDEVQTLPVGLLAPILDQLQQLCSNYGTTLLLTTATQPALHSRQLGPHVFEGLDPAPMEIVPAAAAGGLFSALDRVDVCWPDAAVPTPWPEIADALLSERQALAIVHSRKDARALWEACRRRSKDGAHHLSALMCAAHRRQHIGEIKRRLEADEECRVVSTQLIEAGVDVDFPVVFRAMAGLESLAQAAGRCNREGKLADKGMKGRLVVFTAESEPPPGLRQHYEIAKTMLAGRPELNLFQPSTFREYFDRLYGTNSRDAHAIQPLREALRFNATANAFRMIDDSGAAVFVPFDRGAERAIDEFRYAGPSRDRFRKLQPFGVSVAPWTLGDLIRQGAVEQLHETIYVLNSSVHYDAALGLIVEPDPTRFLGA